MLINRSNLLPAPFMLFKVIFTPHLTVSKAKRYPILCVDTHTQFIITNNCSPSDQLCQVQAQAEEVAVKLWWVLADATSAQVLFFSCPFCRKQQEEAVRGTWATFGADIPSLHSWMWHCLVAEVRMRCWQRFLQAGERETGVSLTSPFFPMPCVRAQIHGEKGGGDSKPVPTRSTIKTLLEPLETTETLQTSAPFSPVPSLPLTQTLPIPVSDICAPASTCLSTQPLHLGADFTERLPVHVT